MSTEQPIVSPHFTFAEVCRSQEATRRGFDNTPPAAVLPAIRHVAWKILEPLRMQYGAFSPSSWYRSPQLNFALGSGISSQHVKGEAADIEISGVTNRALADWIAANLPYDQLILEFYAPGKPFSGWVHVSSIDEADPANAAVGRKNRRQLLTITAAGTHLGLAA